VGCNEAKGNKLPAEFLSVYKDELKDLEYGGYAVFDEDWKVE